MPPHLRDRPTATEPRSRGSGGCGERPAAAADLGAARGDPPARGGHDARLPGPGRLRPAPGQRRRRRPRPAFLHAYLAAEHPGLQRVRDVDRPQVEGFKTWVAARPGQNKARVTPATIAHRLGTLRVFFTRIDEWGWDDAPPRVPMFLGDVPRQHHALPKALDDPTAAKLLRAAQADRRMLVGVTVEFLLRTGLRVGEYTALAADAVVLIGDTHWLHVPVGKLHEDRYLPLHPRIVELIDTYRAAHVPPGHPLLLPRENGKPLDRHAVTRLSTRPAPRPGSPTSTPTSCGTPWPPRPSTAACPSRPSPRCSDTSPWT